MSRGPLLVMAVAALGAHFPPATAAPIWRRVEPGHPVDRLLRGGLLVGEDGWVHGHHPDGTDRAIPPPFSGAEPRYVLDDDGVLWHVTPRPAAVRRWLDGAWSAAEDPGLTIAAGYAFGGGGRAWVGSYTGSVAVRRDGRWEAPRAVDDHAVNAVVPDGLGGAWVELYDVDYLVHLAEDGSTTRVVKPGPWRAKLLTDGSLGWAAPDGPRVREGEAWRPWRAGDVGPVTPTAANRDWVVDGALVRSPCAVREIAAGPRGPWVLCTDGAVLEWIAPEGGHAMVPTTWDAGDLTVLAPVAVDLDLDGRDDLLLTRPDGTLAALVQREERLEPGALPPGLPDGLMNASACDLDADGRQDLVGWSRFDVDAKGGRVVLARRRSGWFDDLAVDSGAPARLEILYDDTAPPRCVDADADGDVDVMVPLGGERHLDGPSLALLENLGAGRFRWRGDARGPAALTWVSDVLPGDFDGDGIQDRAYVAPWKGLAVRRGSGGGGGAVLSWGTGPWGTFHESGQGWVDDLDGDGVDDLLLTSFMRGPRAWLGRPGMALEDATDELGLGALAPMGGKRSAFTDLDGRPGRDLLTCSLPGPCRLMLHQPGKRFSEADASALPLVEQVMGLTPFDLGGDGDSDLLVVGRGRERLLENRSRDPGPDAPEPPAVRPDRVVLHAVARHPLGLVLALGVAVSPAAALLALPRRRLLGLLGLLGAGLALVASADLPPGPRAAVAFLAFGATAFAFAAARLAEGVRSARRIDRYVVLDRLGSGGLGTVVGSSRVDLQACKLEYSIVSPK